ncbi:OLC1v1003431C1 [Oldenlandia corymbosa var. corymbosa]|uniref:OLC1v1003431C1 n=1 Tax=Oldenlandia corymbosa var. corymbosa TaxID=529605 RepID=A0AAV1DAU2_OLDCO|nr:OLC1v1003431C1 [Oldenlandia corymbosa var. corymbosa]
MRFRTICKAWHALILDPYFTRWHYNNSRIRPESSYFQYYLIKNGSPVEAIEEAIISEKLGGVISSRGCNTQQLPLHKFLGCGGTVICSGVVNGLKHCLLGFDPINSEDYKVLYLGCKGKFMWTTLTSKYDTVSHRWRWREVASSPQVEPIRKSPSDHICVDGAILWREIVVVNGERFVPCFEVGEEKFEVLLIHDPVVINEIDFSSDKVIITEIGDEFTLARSRFHDKNVEITLWMLTNRRDQVWFKSTIEPAKALFSGPRICFVGCRNTGNKLLIASKSRKLTRARNKRVWTWILGSLTFCDLEMKDL